MANGINPCSPPVKPEKIEPIRPCNGASPWFSAEPARFSASFRRTESSSFPSTAALFRAPVSCEPKPADSLCRLSSELRKGWVSASIETVTFGFGIS